MLSSCRSANRTSNGTSPIATRRQVRTSLWSIQTPSTTAGACLVFVVAVSQSDLLVGLDDAGLAASAPVGALPNIFRVPGVP